MAVAFLLFFLSFCIGFYSILSVSRCATGPLFHLVCSFLVSFFIVGVGFWGGSGEGGRNNVLSRAFYLSYIVNFLPRTSDTLDATL